MRKAETMPEAEATSLFGFRKNATSGLGLARPKALDCLVAGNPRPGTKISLWSVALYDTVHGRY